MKSISRKVRKGYANWVDPVAHEVIEASEHEPRQKIKLCQDCGEIKPRTDEFFTRQKGGRSGWSARCKKCIGPYWANKRAKRAAVEGSHSAADIEALIVLQNGLCFYCAIELTEQFHVDHRMPISRGGSNDKENLAIACAPCNWSKGAKTDEEFFAFLEREE